MTVQTTAAAPFEQTVKQAETIFVDGEGSPYHSDPHDHVDVLDVECAECGAEVPADDA